MASLPLAIGPHFSYYGAMKKSSTVLRKKKGRPASGETPMLALRLSKEERTAIDDWAAQQEDGPKSRSAAIRQMIKAAAALSKGGKKWP